MTFNIAGPDRTVADEPGEHGGGPSAAASGCHGALTASDAGLCRLLPGPSDPGNAAARAPCLDLRSTTFSCAYSYSDSGEYIACCFSLCGHPAGTNEITCPLCRNSRRVRTRLQVSALHWALLHRTGGRLTRPSRLRASRGQVPLLLHRRSRGTSGPTRRSRRRRSQGGLRGSKVGALGPLGTPGRARYLYCPLVDLSAFVPLWLSAFAPLFSCRFWTCYELVMNLYRVETSFDDEM